MERLTLSESPPDDPVDPKQLDVDERRRRVTQEPQTITTLKKYLKDSEVGGTPVCLLCSRFADLDEAKQHELEEHIDDDYNHQKLTQIPDDEFDAHWVLVAEISGFTHPRVIEARKRRILRRLREAGEPLETKDVCEAFNSRKVDRELVVDYLQELQEDDDVVQTEDGWRPASGGG